MLALEIALVLAALLCGLAAGLVFGFAVVVMPGIAILNDREFIRAFQVIDGVIQRGQPLFGLVWLGSVAAMVVSMVLGVGQLEGLDQALLVAAGLSYLFGAQLPTFAVNIPLNNELQRLDLGGTDASTWRSARERFERRWNRWNMVRTVVASLSATALMILLLRI